MSFVTAPRTPRDERPARTHSIRSRPRVLELENRITPATSLVDAAQGLLSAGAGDAEVLAITPDGRYAIFASEGTDLIPNQIDIPGTRDLFWIDFLIGQKKLITAAPAAVPLPGVVDKTTGGLLPDAYSYDFARASFGFTYQNVETFGQAVMSDDGNFVAFTSKVDAGELDADYATKAQLAGSARTTPGDRGNSSYDVFRWNSKSGAIQLGSRTFNNKSAPTEAFGFRAESSNPSINSDGTKVAFVSNRNAQSVYNNTLVGVNAPMRDSGDDSPDIFLVDFIRIDNDVAQDTGVVTYVPNKYQAALTKLPTFPFREQNATFGFASKIMPLEAGAFGQVFLDLDGDGFDDFVGSLKQFNNTTTGIKVDKAGRYLSAAGDTITFLSDISPHWIFSSVVTGSNYAPTVDDVPVAIGKLDVYAYTLPNVDPPTQFNTSATGTGNSARIITITAQDPDDVLDPHMTLAVAGGTAQNSIVARQNSDRFLFVAGVPGSGFGDTLVPLYSGATGTTSEEMNLYMREHSLGAVAGQTPILVNAIDADPITPGNGVLPTDPLQPDATDPQVDPESYQITPDGQFVAFVTDAGNMIPLTKNIPADRNSVNDVYRRDLNLPVDELGAVTVASVNAAGRLTPNGASTNPSISVDGRYIAFQSAGTDLVGGGIDTNKAIDVFVRDYQARVNSVTGAFIPGNGLASLNAAGTASGNGASTNPLISANRVLFTSAANDLVNGITVPATTQHGYNATLPLTSGTGTGNVSVDVGAVSGGFVSAASLVRFDGNAKFVFDQKFTPFPGFTGELRVASADITGDGVADLVVGAGPGGGPRVVVIDGSTGDTVRNFFAFESSFLGGVTVAAANFNGVDTDGINYADVLIGADAGGGARVQVYDGKTGVKRADFFAYEATFRGGVRIAAGDITGDGTPDVITGAGLGGGPRVSVFNGVAIGTAVAAGTGLLSTAPARAADYFAFEPTLRNGVYVGAGDVNADSNDDVVVGGGPGGGPRITAFDGKPLISGVPDPILNFFAFDPSSRNGVRVAVRDIDGDSSLDILAGEGLGQSSRIRGFASGLISTDGTPGMTDEEILFGDFASFNGAWVG